MLVLLKSRDVKHLADPKSIQDQLDEITTPDAALDDFLELLTTISGQSTSDWNNQSPDGVHNWNLQMI